MKTAGILLAFVLLLAFYFNPSLIKLPIDYYYYEFRPWFGTSDPACEKQIQNLGISHQAFMVPEKDRAQGCFMIEGMIASWDRLDSIDLGPGSKRKFAVGLSCSFLKALAEFEKETLQVLSEKYFHQKMLRMLHRGTYSCRNQEGSELLSEHSYGLAIDLSEFLLEDGTRIRVEEYLDPNSPHFPFLHSVAEAACKKFGTVLTPVYNKSHHDHFHISMGLFGECVY